MISFHDRFQRFLNLLRAGYESQPTATVSESWQWDVMRTVRNFGALNAAPNPFGFLNQFTWRFATVACAATLMLSAYMAYTGLSSGTELVSQMLDHPVEFLLVQALGGY